MSDADDIERSLAIVRDALLPPMGARERVLAEVASRRAGDGGVARAKSRRGVTKLTTTVLVGAGFVTGYWLGLHQSGVSSDGAPTASMPALSPPPSSDLAKGSGLARPSGAEAAPAGGNRLPSAPSSESARWPVPASEGTVRAEAGAGAAATFASSPGAPRAGASPEPGVLAPAEAQRIAAASGRAAIAPRARPAASPPLDDELTLLSRVERSLRAGEAALALTFLDELDRQHPRSTLLEERIAARRLADCILDVPGAPARAEQFLRDHRGSVYSDRLQRTCALAASGDGARPANAAGASER